MFKTGTPPVLYNTESVMGRPCAQNYKEDSRKTQVTFWLMFTAPSQYIIQMAFHFVF